MRRLSAIMFTDVVGYSKLTQENESLALDLLEEHRGILRPIFDKYSGHEIETAGDSFFVEFNSAVEAANCAIEIQATLYQRHMIVPQSRNIQLRIGLHIGDVVYMDEHVHGDGVNIAARIEPLAESGGICVSEDVSRQIRNKLDYPVVKLKKRKLKNISMSMNIYRIALPWIHSNQNGKIIFTDKRVRKMLLIVSILLIVALIFLYINQYN